VAEKLVSVSIVEKKTGSWSAVGRELSKRTCDPLSHFSFVAYFLIAVVVLGGMGVWLELYSHLFLEHTTPENTRSLASVRTALITFFPALAGSACMQLIWAENNQKSLRAFAAAVLVLLTMGALMIAPTAVRHEVALGVGAFFSLIALWTWVIANAKQQDLLDPDAPLGKKDLNAELAGNLDGFEV